MTKNDLNIHIGLENKLPRYDAAVRGRARLEMAIVTSAVTELLSHGYTLSVDDGEEVYAPTREASVVFAELMDTDEDYLLVTRGEDNVGIVRFVYGNDGWDVINDWSVCLDQHLTNTMALVDRLSE